MDPSLKPDRTGARPAARRPVDRSAHSARTRQSGFTLIEVLVALIVLVLGVLGAAAMTLTSLRDGKQSGLRSQATALAYEVGDIMRANRATTPLFPQGGEYESTFTGTQPTSGVPACWTTGCTPSEMATNDFYVWLQKVGNGLPNGHALICRDYSTPATTANFTTCDNSATSPLVVKLEWDEKNNNARGAATTTNAISTQVLVVTLQPY